MGEVGGGCLWDNDYGNLLGTCCEREGDET